MDKTLRSHVNHHSPRQQQTSFCWGECASTASTHAPTLGLGLLCRGFLAAMQSWPLPAMRLRRKRRSVSWNLVLPVVLTLLALLRTSGAVYVEFENCLSPDIIYSASQPQPVLQFTPYHVWASFNDSAPSHTFNVTVYGNISGIATTETRPAWNDPQWLNNNETLGKIVDEDQDNSHWSTFFARFNVLDYTPYDAPPSRFCQNTIHQQCPLIPAFNLTGNKYVGLSAPHP